MSRSGPPLPILRDVIALVEVDEPSRDALRRELSDYLVEFAEMEGVPVARSADGNPDYRWFDRYWVDADRMPFFIETGSAIAGFCLIRVLDGDWNIAEFAIRPEWRRQRVGRRSVEVLAQKARLSGADQLIADVHTWNDRALKFWAACGFRQVRAKDGIVHAQLPLEPNA